MSSPGRRAMMLCRSWMKAGVVALFFVVMASAAHAQYRTSIQGSVTDPDGASVPGAKLTLVDKATNATQVRTSGDDGVYNFNALPADQFKLTVEKSGFKTQVLDNLQLIPEQANAITVKLQLGAVDTSVTVDASTTPAVDTETANIGATISSNDIQHTPSFNRDVFTLTQLAPGTISDGSQASGGGVYQLGANQGPGGSASSGQAPTENGPQSNANGGQYETNGITIDGISTVSAVWGGTTVITPTEDSIDNVRIVTNDYDAENGRFSGAQTMVTSKSGTNQLHGSAFLAIHRPGLNAYNRYSGGGTPIRDNKDFNQYGGSLGGPILKNRVFAFFAFESSPSNANDVTTGWYTTPAFAALAPSGSVASTFLNFPGSTVNSTGIVTTNEGCANVGLQEGVNCNTIAGQGLNLGSPLTTALGTQDLTATGTAQNPGVGSGINTTTADIADYITVNPSSTYYRQFNGRADANVTSKDHLAFAIYWVPQGYTQYNNGNRAYNLYSRNQINDAFSVIYNHTFSPSFLNEARANAAGYRWNEITSNPNAPFGLPNANPVDVAPSLVNNGNTGTGLAASFGSELPSVLNQWTYGYKDVATKILGQHTVKFGGEYTSLHYLNQNINRPSYNFYNIWDFLNDAPSSESGGFNPLTGAPQTARQDDRENLFGAFVQDDWKARTNLTLHAGLRYSYFGALYDKQNSVSVAHFGAGAAAYTGLYVTQGGNLWNPQKGNFGPQLGFNWAPTMFKNAVTVRGGYGLNFNQEEIAITANTFNNPPSTYYPSFAYASPTNPGTGGANILYGVSSSPTNLFGFAANPHAITTYNTANLPTAGNANVTLFGNGQGNLATQYAHHFSLDTEYQFLHDWLVASVGYQGSLSRHLIAHENPIAPAAVAGVAQNPLVTGGDYWTNEGSGNNHALLLELKHPFSHQFSADAQFMFAKSMDTDGSGPYFEDEYFPQGAGYSYGRSDFNISKSFKAFGLWQPVFFHGDHRWLEKVAGEWSISGILNLHTGLPWTPNYGISDSLYCSQCGYYNLRPQYLGGAKHSHGNAAFEALPTSNASNFYNIQNNQATTTATVNGTPGTVVAYSNQYFNVPNFYNAIQSSNGTGFPANNLALPGTPGADRNTFDGPNYRDLDMSIAKGFGFPDTRLLGNNAKFEIRADIFNIFNLLDLNPGSVSNNVNSTNFGQDTAALSGRTITLQGRFSF
ncbi:carboxypeptidase regulatory-like domain-containing protein [Granulicella sp. 5B5]|nr:carboxypeptidase regulatory-like domain-containing protein [Granulicella sp. 5B5]